MTEAETRLLGATIFKDGAKYIRTYGWRRSGMSEHGLPRCSMGALASAYPLEHWDERLSEIMYEELYDELGGIGLTQFNHLHDNGETVARLFEKVALRLEKSAHLANR